MDKVKILVACHKPAKVYQDEVYTPIQVGKALHPELDLGFITDATGDNISSKNGNYSELTAQYWAWKNLKDVEYIGLCHYRRYFKHLVTFENIDTILGNHADVLQVERLEESIDLATRLMLWTSREDYYIFLMCLRKVHPEDFSKALEYLGGNMFSPFNMFIIKKKLFDEFARWQFEIFSEMEKYVRLSSYSRQKRLYGYLSEPLLSIYAYIHNLRVQYDKQSDWPNERSWQDYSLKDRINIFKTSLSFRLYHGFRRHSAPAPEDFAFDAVRAGMKNDGIVIK